MKYLLVVLLASFTVGCGVGIDVSDSTHTIVVDNPIIAFCERLYPEIIYPDEYERETNIVACLEVCTAADNCTIEVPTNL